MSSGWRSISCIFIIAILAYMLYVVKTQFATEIDDVFFRNQGTWEMECLSAGLAATHPYLGSCSTMIIQRIRLFPER
ncbi:MAG: hypothetical protein ACLTT1_10995 [[Clostridium] scindens]